MTRPLPSSLSPSKVASFTSCALAFRFSAIDRLPEPPSAPAVKGTLVHRALELLFVDPAPRRTPDRAAECLAQATEELRSSEEWEALALDEVDARRFVTDAQAMVDRYFALEDPTAFDPIGLELKLELDLDGLVVRGIIDRLDRTPEGDLVVTDYKTGRTPREQQESARLVGVQIYALMCERLFGVRPAAVRLMYLGREPQVITSTPTEQSTRAVGRRLAAVWDAVERACERDDFRPRRSPLCDWCGFRRFCPEFGGDPALAATKSIATPIDLRTSEARR